MERKVEDGKSGVCTNSETETEDVDHTGLVENTRSVTKIVMSL